MKERVPQSLRNKAIRKENVLAEQKAKAEALLKNNKVPMKAKKRVASLLEKGAYDSHQEVIVPKYAKEIDRTADRAIRDAIKRGDIKPARRDDPYYHRGRK